MKFSEGGRAERMRDRRLADIEKDYQRALARGKPDKVARAKREQRLADAYDDYAKRTGADRTQTRAAERDAEARLKAARRSPDKYSKPVSIIQGGDKPIETPKIDLPKVKTPKVGEDKPTRQSFSKAFAAARKSGAKTFMWNGGRYTTELEGEKKSVAPSTAKQPPSTSTKTGDGRGPIGAMVDNMLLMGRQVRVPPKSSSTPPQKPGNTAENPVGEFRRLTGSGPRYIPDTPFKVPKPSPLVRLYRHIQERGRASDPTLNKAKGGKIDGIAVRGKTRAKRKK
jgi:hypothetical protein